MHLARAPLYRITECVTLGPEQCISVLDLSFPYQVHSSWATTHSSPVNKTFSSQALSGLSNPPPLGAQLYYTSSSGKHT